MSDTRIELAPAICQSLALLPNAAEAIDRVYNTDRGRFFAASKQNQYSRDPLFESGRASHRINALKALGILTAGTEEEQKLLLRSADRKTYDRVLSASKSLGVGERLFVDSIINDDRNESDDTFFARCVVMLGVCSVLSVPVQYTPFIEDIVTHITAGRRIASARQKRVRNEKAVAKMTSALGSDRINGLTGLYNSVSDKDRERYDHLYTILNMEGVDGGLFTDSVLLTPLDACAVSENGDPFVNAFVTLLARAVHLDRDTCLDLYNDTRPDRIDAARHEAGAARASEKEARARIRELEKALSDAERKLSAIENELASKAGDSSELAALREALFNASERSAHVEMPKIQRELPEGVIAIGGHPTWARQIEDATGIRCWPAGTTCPASVVSSASEIWIQASYMAHSDYYAAINRARTGNIRVRYFSSTGVTSCVSELMAPV